MRATATLLALGTAIVLLVAAGLMAQPHGSFGGLYRDDAIHYVACALAAGLLYALAVHLVRTRRFPAWTTGAIVALGLLARLLVLAAPPLLSTDIYRYVWDGRVQAAGINPYRYIPADPALAPLRDMAPNAGPSAGPNAAAIYPNINRADTAPTIYPPAAQALFALVGLVAPSIWTMKAALLAFDLLATAAALLLLRAARRPAALVLIWAWNPLAVWEFAGAGHIDAAAAALTGLAMLAATYARPAWAGAALAGAVLFKLLPAAVFPALWRRWDWRTPAMAGAVIVLAYAAYASVGWRVLGYLPGYAAEEGLDGGGFLLVRLLALFGRPPHWTGQAYALASLLLLGGVAAWVGLRAPLPADRPARALVIARGVLLLSGALMAVLSPHYPWYLTMLVLPATIAPAWSALWLTIAAPLLYLDTGRDDVLWPTLVFLPALPLLALDYRTSPAIAEGAA